MKKNSSTRKNRKEEDSFINLTPTLAVHIKRMVENGIPSAYNHVVHLPKEMFNNSPNVLCVMTYELKEPQTELITLKDGLNDCYTLHIDDIMMKICQAYQKYDKEGLLEDPLESLWIVCLFLHKNLNILEVIVAIEDNSPLCDFAERTV